MEKEKPTPNDATKKAKKMKVIPCQKTFGFPIFTPSFIMDWWINKWMGSLVMNQGTVPMLGKIGEGLLVTHFTYMYTKQIEIND